MQKRRWQSSYARLKQNLGNKVMRKKKESEIYLQGAPVSEGVAIGSPFFLGTLQEDAIPEFPIAVSQVDEEIARYRRALFSSREDLETLQNNLAREGSRVVMTIIDTHIQMLDDPLITTDMEEKIRQRRQNTESVFRGAIHEYEKRFCQSADSFFQQRLIDVMDVSKRILGHLNPRKKVNFSDVPEGAVVFTKELIPSDMATVQASRVSAFITQVGGGNSHAAVIARAKGIPFVAGIDIQKIKELAIDTVIVDGGTGDVIVNPYPDTIEKYTALREHLRQAAELLEKESALSAQTQDGHAAKVFANVGSLHDLDLMHRYSADGVGLLRSEYLYLQKSSLFYSEEEQYTAYVEMFTKAGALPIVLRIFDVGGDKDPDFFLTHPQEERSALAFRGIRFLLKRKEILETQLRAVLKASSTADLKILIPLVSDISELREVKKMVEAVKKDLGLEKKIPIGCMIEVPSALMICDALALESDFLSIGTNDLCQYTLGVDRSTHDMGHASLAVHPSLIRMIKMVVSEAEKNQKPLSICGEMASNPRYIPLLLGLGVKQLSCTPRYIPFIKQAIRSSTYTAAKALAEHVLTLKTTEEIEQALLA
jgi:phosphoenolpyruvate-protein phosphotransferase